MSRLAGVVLSLLAALAACSSGRSGGLGNVNIHIERHYGPPPTDPGPNDQRGNDAGGRAQ